MRIAHGTYCRRVPDAKKKASASPCAVSASSMRQLLSNRVDYLILTIPPRPVRPRFRPLADRMLELTQILRDFSSVVCPWHSNQCVIFHSSFTYLSLIYCAELSACDSTTR
jgi:hypothetical protein